ncbi:MAG: hypothetical protein IJU48_02265 [Synergistaceae bacterium]|nr:hypothetical protein [Synergistaceae bacterium]
MRHLLQLDFVLQNVKLISAKIGSVLGPASAVVDGLTGGTASYVASSKVGEFVTEKIHEVKEKIIDTVSNFAVSAVKKISLTVKSGFRRLTNCLF